MLVLVVGLPTLVHAATGVAVGTTAMPDGEVGVAYSQTLTATGGTAPYTWAITSGGLPAGLSLNPSTGAITGTPSASDTTSFTVEVIDHSSPATTATATLSITINDQVAVGTTTLAAGEVGVAYSQTLAASGGVTPYSWSLTSGTLPDGLALDPTTGVIAGTPSAAGSSSITVEVTDAAGAIASQDLSITIGSGALAISTTSLPDAEVGVAYSQTVAAVNGTSPYTWSVTAGSLPDGLALDPSTGEISGTPSTAGPISFTLQVTDNASPAATASQAYTLNVNPATTLAIATTSLPNGTVGLGYAAMVGVVGGTTPYTWTISSGTLPTGLTLDGTTGTISGTPSAAGASTFTVQVTDNASPAATVSQAYTLTIASSTQSSGGAAAVQAACQDTTAHPGLVALCGIYANQSLPQFVQSVIGRVILKLAGVTPPNKQGEDARAKHGDHAEQSGQSGDAGQGNQPAAVCAPSATPTPTPAWMNFGTFFKGRERSRGDGQAQQSCQGTQSQGQQDQLQSSTGGSQGASTTSWFGAGRGPRWYGDN